MIAIDLGSNTFRCIEYDCRRGEWGRDFERIVKTADGLHRSQQISPQAIARIVAAVEDAKKEMDFCVPVVAVTTAAMRMAVNSDDILNQIEEQSGIRFRVIVAEDEARYTMTAVRNRLKALGIAAESFVLIDIGGGSTEVMFYREGVFESRSFPVGIVTIAQQCGSPGEVRNMLKSVLQPVREYINACYSQNGRPGSFVATAGTATTVAAFLRGMTYAAYDAKKINGVRLTLTECDYALQRLLALDDDERAIYVGVGKETLIVAGVIIVEAFYELLGFEEAIIVDDGLREGVALEYCRLHGSRSSAVPPNIIKT